MPHPRVAASLAAAALLMPLAAVSAAGQTVQPSTAREAAARLLAPHFGGPGDATVDYLGQLLARTIATSPAGPLPLDPRDPPRAVTVGVDYQRLRVRRFDGIELDTGDLSSFTGGLSRPPVTSATTMELSVDVATVVAGAALSPRLALALRAPIVRLGLSGERRAIEDLGTPFEQPAASPVRVPASSFSGLGDLTTAIHWRLLERDRLRLAAAGGIRWPTGDSENLAGAGEMVPEATVLVSFIGPAALTLDAAVSFANGHGTTIGEFTSPPFSGPIVANARPLDTWTYGAAARWTLHRRLAVDGDIAFRTMLEAVRYERAALRSSSAVQRALRLVPRLGAVTDASAGMAVQFHVGGPAFLRTGVTVPLGASGGLQPGASPYVGIRVAR